MSRPDPDPPTGVFVKPGRVFSAPRPLVGMIHLPALPGSPGWRGSMERVVRRAEREAELLANAGLDGLLVENFGDAPFLPGSVPAETVAALSVAVDRVRRAVPIPVGVNVLRNDARAALAVAVATRARFIRVNVHVGSMFTDQGLIEGSAHETLRLRRFLGADVLLLADVLVKHAHPPPGQTLERAARDLRDRGRADVLVISGPETGSAPDPGRLERVRRAAPDAPVWLGSGLAPENAARLLPLADGAIVGSAVRRQGRAGAPVDADRLRRLLETVGALR